MKKQYLYIILAIFIIIGIIIYKLLNNNKTNNKLNDIIIIPDKNEQKTVNIDLDELKNLDSIEKARRLGVPEDEIIKNNEDLDNFMSKI